MVDICFCFCIYSLYVVLFLFSVYTHVEWMDCSDTEKEFGGVGV